ncbi:MAG: hypothetical protein QM791_04245 [Ferruginibacter sp.]
MSMKIRNLQFKIMECRLEAAVMTCDKNYEMYAVVKSRMDPAAITKEQMDYFNWQVAKNKAANPSL